MKLTDPENISENEKDFIDTINAELDWEAIEKMLLEKHNFTLQDEIDYKNGDLIVYQNKIAYKFDFDIKVPLSVIFNREGECLEISTFRKEPQEADSSIQTEGDIAMTDENQEMDIDSETAELQDAPLQTDIESGSDEKISKMASNIADMISEINQEDE